MYQGIYKKNLSKYRHDDESIGDKLVWYSDDADDCIFRTQEQRLHQMSRRRNRNNSKKTDGNHTYHTDMMRCLTGSSDTVTG